MKRISIIAAVALGVTLVWACSSAVEEFVLTPDASADYSPSESKSGSRLQIRPIVYEGDDGSVIRMGEEIFDTELGVVCEPMLAADGVVRCLPKQRTLDLGTFYSDANCSTPAPLVDMTDCEEEFYTVRIPRDSCDSNSAARHAVYQVGEEDKTVYFRINEDCIAGDSTTKERIEIPASEFAAFRRTE